uniref:AB hydrolase-1 domain-containing protein n=1 Tax=Entomoneis paludosa TaxID=265537 RepID=A0A7S2Y4C4_9STRA|mmetsp:Transcript_16760/g.34597  ORF Transcript_16760/g.34597 Transcript_16760/m.34597 type:complete len:300 (+) Transcript_16760:152-1051(+)
MDSGCTRIQGKRPIVFVHGFPELWISWLDQMKYYIMKGHPVLALNMRGYGNSEKPKNLESFHLYDNILDDIRAAVMFLKSESKSSDAPLLVAHDWGASICWAYACHGQTTKDGEIAGYASLAIPPGECFEANMNLSQLWASLYIFFFNMPWLPEKAMLANNGWLIGCMMNATKNAILPPWMINAYRANCLQEGAMTAQLNYYRHLVQKQPKPHPDDLLGPHESIDKLGEKLPGRRLDLPVLMIRGKDDGALTEHVFVGYDRYLNNARLVALDNCSHWIQADCPNEVHQELDNFLEQIAK